MGKKVEIQHLPYMGEREDCHFQNYAHDPKLGFNRAGKNPTMEHSLVELVRGVAQLDKIAQGRIRALKRELE